MSTSLVYLANSKKGNPNGITVAKLDYDTGTLEVIQQVTDISECHYLNFHPNGKFLVATTTSDNYQVVTFAVDENTGHLSKINNLPAEGTSPCYVMIEDSAQYVLMVNYTVAGARGNIRLYPIDENGQLHANTEMIVHDGHSVNESRQQESHPHMIVTTPDNRFAIVPDLGTDKVYIYALDTAQGKLSLHTTLDLQAGAGPRHVAFHPTESWMYIINELDSTMVAYQFETENDTWTQLATLSTLPVDYKQDPEALNYPADVHVHPNGKFLYGSNRQHDSIVIYALNDEGIPSLVGHESTQGHWPRAFMIDPTGKILIVGNQNTDTAVVFAIDSDTGLLSHQSTIDLAAPIAIKMLG